MPITTFNIAANADDGMGWHISPGTSSAVYPNSNVAYIGTPSPVAAGWLTFTGINIPMGTTINSATLKCYMVANYGSILVTLKQDARQTPTFTGYINPQKGTQVTTPASVMTTTPAPTIVFTTVTNTTKATRTNFTLKSLDVTNWAQALVNQWDYTNGNMVYFIGHTGPAVGIAFVYQKDFYTSPPPGGTSRVAELVIDYSAGETSHPLTKNLKPYVRDNKVLVG